MSSCETIDELNEFHPIDSTPVRILPPRRHLSHRGSSTETVATSSSGDSVGDFRNSLERKSSNDENEIESKISGLNRKRAISIAYRGMTIYSAARQGNLPVCVLLWGMAAAKKFNLVVPDLSGNNLLHFAALADTPEVHILTLKLITPVP